MEPKVIVNGREYPLVPYDNFTLGERADAERLTGQDYDWRKEGEGGLLAVIYVSVSRVDASVSLDDIRHLTDKDISIVTKDAEPVPPPNADASNGSEPSSIVGSGNGSALIQDATLASFGAPV